jgi:hypothetical protein
MENGRTLGRKPLWIGQGVRRKYHGNVCIPNEGGSIRLVGAINDKGKKSNHREIKSKYWQSTHTYDIRVPKTIDEALTIGAENNNEYWKKAIEEEMRKINEMPSNYIMGTQPN